MTRWALIAIALSFQFGCGNSDSVRKFHVSGKVTHKGQPVPYGRIVFDPDRTKGNEGPQGVAEIENGKYDTSAGQGVVGGAYTVLISGFGAKPNLTDETQSVPALFPDDKRNIDLPEKTTTVDFDIQ